MANTHQSHGTQDTLELHRGHDAEVSSSIFTRKQIITDAVNASNQVNIMNWQDTPVEPRPAPKFEPEPTSEQSLYKEGSVRSYIKSIDQAPEPKFKAQPISPAIGSPEALTEIAQSFAIPSESTRADIYGSGAGQLEVFSGGLKAQKAEQRRAAINKSLIHYEAKLGGELFGPIPAGRRREFFCLDTHTWVWHEEWTDNLGKRQAMTTRYDVRPSGVLKSQGGSSYQRLSGTEASNFYKAVNLYGQLINSEYDRMLHAA